MSQALSPKSPRKGKHVNLRVVFLDDLVHAFPCPVKSIGQVLWDGVIQHLSLLESDYFDLMFQDESGQTCWLDRDKQATKQLPTPDTPLTFCVKFYTPDPGLLDDELTRYLFALQVKRDLVTGVMPCSENTAALLASYIAQAEIGDFLIDEYTDCSYLSDMKFTPHQTSQLLQKIMEYHRQHIGETPSEADCNLLDTARKIEMFGIKLHPAKDHEGVTLTLAVAHMGVLVFQTSTKINTFSWAKIRKLSFKRKKFLIKLHPDSYGFYKDTVEFFLDTRNDCKAFWKKCIEHHAFFRCQVVRKVARNKTRVVSRGSSFRYSGRTQKQLVEYMRENTVKRPEFERSTSGRLSSRSTSVTPKVNPKTAIHNSSDIHNSTASSGSHILDPLLDNHVSPTRVEMAEVHSDSSMSGSRSLGSPKLEHGMVISDSVDSANHKTEEEMRLEDTANLKREAEDKGAESDKLKTISNNVDMHIELANQNANDNDDDLSEDSYHLDDGGEESRAVKLRDVGGKYVTFSDVDGVCIDDKSGKSMKDLIEGKIAEGVCDDEGSDQEFKGSNIDLNDERVINVEPSVCITASVKDFDEKQLENDVTNTETKILVEPKTSPVLDQNANTPIEDEKNVEKRKLSDDLIGDIPYYLHRRLIEGENESRPELSVYTALEATKSHEGLNELNLSKSKRSPSPAGKLKFSNINIQQFKHNHSPSPPTRRSRVLDRTSPSDRSPSTHRRLELVHSRKLPPRDSYSSIDDTTSPSFEKDILKQIEVNSARLAKETEISDAKQTKNVVTVTMNKSESISDVNELNKNVEKESLPAKMICEITLEGVSEDRKTPDIDKAIETAEHELKTLKTDNSLVAAASSKTEQKVVFNIWGQSVAPGDEPSELDQKAQKSKAAITSEIVEMNLASFQKDPEYVAVNKPILPIVLVEISDNMGENQKAFKEKEIVVEAQVLEKSPEQPVNLPEDSTIVHIVAAPKPEKNTFDMNLCEMVTPKLDMESDTLAEKKVHEVVASTSEKDQGTSVDPLPVSKKPPPPVSKKPPPILTKPKKPPVKLPELSKQPFVSPTDTIRSPVPTTEVQSPTSDHTVIAVKPKITPKDAKIPVKEKKKEPIREPQDERPKSVMTSFGVQIESPGPEENRPYVVDSNEDKNAWYSVKPDPKQTQVFMEEIPSPKSNNTGGKNIFDLPSPAAAFVYSDDDSPPSKEEPSPTELTFSTFRPDPSDTSPVEQQPATPVPIRTIRADRDPKQRWSLQKVEEEDESVAKRALAATKRVSFHGELRESYNSDVSMLVLRSPLDDDSSLGSHHGDPMGSHDYLQTLENLQNRDSESDMMFSGSSGTDSDTDTEIMDNINSAKEIYMQYAATKCLKESGRDTTVDSGVGECEARDLSPLDTLEKLKNMEGSFVSEGKFEEADFPPPPPFLENTSDSSSDIEITASKNKRHSIDPLANLEYTDIVEYTTSESESDFEDKSDGYERLTKMRLSIYSSPDDPVQSPDDIEELLVAAEKVND